MAADSLTLLAVDPALAAAVREGRNALAAHLGVSVPEGWPVFPHAFRGENFTDAACAARGPWGGFLFIDRTRRALVGNGGFKGAPGPVGEVEIGYEIAPAFRREGYATRATLELLRRAFGDERVLQVQAHTLASSIESAGVLRKCDFERVEEVSNDELGAIWKWSRSREAVR